MSTHQLSGEINQVQPGELSDGTDKFCRDTPKDQDQNWKRALQCKRDDCLNGSMQTIVQFPLDSAPLASRCFLSLLSLLLLLLHH